MYGKDDCQSQVRIYCSLIVLFHDNFYQPFKLFLYFEHHFHLQKGAFMAELLRLLIVGYQANTTDMGSQLDMLSLGICLQGDREIFIDVSFKN